MTGEVKNSSTNTINYTSTAYYYDANYNLIAKGSNSNTAISGTSSFNQMSNLNILNGHSVNEIVYYNLSIETIDNIDSSTIDLTPSKNNQYSFYEYVIDNYDINIIVNENNTLDVTETITAYFNISKHGIIRNIPLKNKITRLDGTKANNQVQISKVSVDNEYKTSKANGNYQIKIDSANRTLTGEQTYVIKYTYNLGKDHTKNYDELYYNIIGNEWDTVIGNVTFSITMPKEFDSSKLGFSSGEKGSINNDKVQYNVSGNQITGSYNGILEVGEALTIRCELPEGYFAGAGFTIDFLDYIMFLIPIIFLGISILLWYRYGRDDQVIETVEFYPPEGFNSLEVGFLYKGKAGSYDVVSLLIYLANKGYIKITEIEQKLLFSKTKSFKITKLKEYDGNNVNEKLFLEGLFKNRAPVHPKGIEKDSIDIIHDVTPEDLHNSFYKTIDEILVNINSKENRNKIFEKSASGKTIFIVLMIIATYCLITIPPIFAYGEPAILIPALLFPGIGFSLMFLLVFGGTQTIYVNGRATSSSIGTKLFGLVWGGMFGGIPWAFMVLPALSQDFTYLIGYIIGLGCVLGMVICIKYLPKRTAYGNEILGKLKGFRNFLETAEKERLEAMVMQDPSYFYNILPYTYVLGVSDKWIKKFETISLQVPTWYDSPAGFNVATFGTFMNNTIASAQSAMTSNPSSSSSDGSSFGGGSSGGGFSGGGSGGGGGSSW